MPASQRHRDYWNKNLRLIAVLLSVWLVATFGVMFYARELADLHFFSWSLSFYMAAQGSLIIYVAIVWLYSKIMKKMDQAQRAAALNQNDAE